MPAHSEYFITQASTTTTLPLTLTEVGLIKNAEYIAKQQEEMALEAAGGDASKVLGVLMDNPPANRKAMVIIEEKNTT